MTTKIRSSKQLLIDADLDLNSKKQVNVSAGVAATDGINKGQMEQAISNAITAGSPALHVPVQNVAAAKAVPAGERVDKMMMVVEDLGLYRFDAESSVASNDNTVIRPSDIASDASPGRWIKMSATISDHNNLSNIQGGGTGDYQHLTTTQLTKLNGIEANADVTDAANVGSVINAATAKAAMVDADTFPLSDSAASGAIKKASFTNLKAFLKTYFDTLYQGGLGYTAENVANKDASGGYVGLTAFKINIKNAAGNITSWLVSAATTVAKTYTFQDRNGTIADDTDITAAKARGNHTGTQTAATISDFAAAALAAAPAETPASIGTMIGTTATVKATPIDADELGFSDSAASGLLKSMTFTNLKAFLKTYFDTLYNNYTHPAHTGEVTGSAALTITDGAVIAARIAANAVTTVKILDANVTTAKIADGNITNAKMAANSVNGTNLVDNAVGTAKIVDASVLAAKIADNNVLYSKLPNQATSTFLGRKTAATGNPEVLTVADVKTILGLNTSNLSSRTYRAALTRVTSNSYTVLVAGFISGSEEVYRNGMLMNGGGDDYTLSYVDGTAEIILITAADADEKLLINYSQTI